MRSVSSLERGNLISSSLLLSSLLILLPLFFFLILLLSSFLSSSPPLLLSTGWRRWNTRVARSSGPVDKHEALRGTKEYENAKDRKGKGKRKRDVSQHYEGRLSMAASYTQGPNKPRFLYCADSNNNVLCVRVIQGHSGGELVAPELLNHVAIPPGWKEKSCHVRSSFSVNSILQAGGKDTKEGR